jgi:hypothetical protein
MGLELNGLGVLGPDSTSYSFDKRANGYGRGEGIAAVVLKRMSDAIRDGDSKSFPSLCFQPSFYHSASILGMSTDQIQHSHPCGYS